MGSGAILFGTREQKRWSAQKRCQAQGEKRCRREKVSEEKKEKKVRRKRWQEPFPGDKP